MTVDLGVHIGQQNLTMDELRSLWRRCDETMDWISAWDHFYEAPPQGGTVDHFEAVATLAAAYGYDFPPAGQRLDMLEEAVPLIRRLLTEDRTTHAGEWFRTQDASCLPRPIQERLPIWVGGTGERRTLRIAAREADGWNAAYVAPEEFRRLNGVLDGWCELEGRDPGAIKRAINLQFMLAVDDTAAARAREQVEQQWGALAPHVMAGGLSGTPDAAVERIAEYVEAGADAVNVALRAPWPPEALDAGLDDVVPRVRAAT